MNETETVEVELNYCDRCGDGTESDLLTVDRGRSSGEWCQDCVDNHAFTCDDCGETFDNNSGCGCNAQGNAVCESCSGDYFTCDDCGDTFSNEDYGSDGVCSGCEETESGTIRDYSADVSTSPIGKGPHYFGVELEVEVQSSEDRDSVAEDVASDIGDFGILKSDGSLDNGFEIVTRPASMDEQRKRWAPFFQSDRSAMRSFKTSTCGLHVHCSRKPLTDLTVAKVVCFTNAEHNRRFLEVIAGRASGHWAEYHAKKLGEGAKCNATRYEAVNLQNHATLEFRIFKGTLKGESVFKAIEFCDALIAFCSPATRSLRETMSRQAFIRFIRADVKRWPHLAAFIDAKWHGRETAATIKFGFKSSNNNQETGEE